MARRGKDQDHDEVRRIEEDERKSSTFYRPADRRLIWIDQLRDRTWTVWNLAPSIWFGLQLLAPRLFSSRPQAETYLLTKERVPNLQDLHRTLSLRAISLLQLRQAHISKSPEEARNVETVIERRLHKQDKALQHSGWMSEPKRLLPRADEPTEKSWAPNRNLNKLMLQLQQHFLYSEDSVRDRAVVAFDKGVLPEQGKENMRYVWCYAANCKMNQKYQKLLCEMSKFNLIDESIILEYCEKIIKNESSQNIR